MIFSFRKKSSIDKTNDFRLEIDFFHGIRGKKRLGNFIFLKNVLKSMQKKCEKNFDWKKKLCDFPNWRYADPTIFFKIYQFLTEKEKFWRCFESKKNEFP